MLVNKSFACEGRGGNNYAVTNYCLGYRTMQHCYAIK